MTRRLPVLVRQSSDVWHYARARSAFVTLGLEDIPEDLLMSQFAEAAQPPRRGD